MGEIESNDSLLITNSLIGSKSVETATSKTADRQELSQYYLKKHRIPELFHNITSALVYERPENPKEFMIDYIGKLKASKMAEVDNPSFFDESNIRCLFGIMDPANKGYINHSQYKSGMENLGVTTYERNPPGTDTDRIELDTFVSEAKDGLQASTATYAI